MRAISLWQPWASFIAIGVKPYETRSWSPPSRLIGQRIAIHAAKQRVDADDVEWWRLVSKGQAGPLPFGAIVCTAILAADFPAQDVPWDEFGDYAQGRRAWHLTQIERLEPAIPARGAQGFWSWNP
jgi:hypothetical protein